MKTFPLLLCAALFAELPAQSPLPQDGADARRPVLLPSEPAPALAAPAGATATTTGWPQRVLFDQPRVDGPLWAVGHAWKASFDGTGCTVIPFFGADAPRDFPLRLEVARATVGGEVLSLVAGEPAVGNGVVRTVRGALTEIVETGLEQLEQSFVFDRLPNRGAIAIDVTCAGDYTAGPIENGLRFSNEFGHFDYTKAVALDAAGKRLPLDIVWTGKAAHIEIPATFVANAQLPIVLDPVLGGWFNLGNPSQVQHDGDTAAIQVAGIGGRTLLVWLRQWSANDGDAWGLLFDANLGLVQTDFIVDTSVDDWTNVAVAGNNYAQNFLVVAEVRIGLFIGSAYHIAGRTVATNAAVGAVFNIEREGVVGIPGNNFHPDVGSDPYFGVGRYTVVFNKRSGFTSDIYMKQVTPAGGLVTTNAIALTASTDDVSNPSISKSCGQSNGLPAYWLVTWQRPYPFAPFDQEVWGRYINWNGALPGAAFGIGLSVGEETMPSAGSPIDANNVRYWPMCYEWASAPGQPRDVLGRLCRADGVLQAAWTVSNNVPGADDRAPEIDSDGMRFVCTLTTGTTGFPQGIEAATFAFLPTSNSIRLEERTGLQTSSLTDYGQTNICAEFSGGSGATPRYALCFSQLSNNTLQLQRYGGYHGGAFFQTRGTQCGNLSIAASGEAVLGQRVTITAGNGALSGTLGGFPLSASLQIALGCNCLLGVDYIGFFGNPFVYDIPNDPLLVGSTFSVQGYTVVGSQCLGMLDLSDTIDFTIR